MIKEKNNKKSTPSWFWVIFFLTIIGGLFLINYLTSSKVETKDLDWFTKETRISNVVINFSSYNTATISGLYYNGVGWVKFVVKTSQEKINNNEIFNKFSIVPYEQSTFASIISSLLPMVIMIAFYGVLIYMFTKGSGSGSSSGMNSIFGMNKSKAKKQKSDVKFSDVAGIEEEKAELVELVDYLKKPEKYEHAGARVPKGVLMEGPPGTGKTLLAKAVAGEANVAFFSIAGSEFEEMFVGVGASRVREMFIEAKKNAPAILFIDEIDAVGRKRSSAVTGGGNEQTLNQLLVEMDGFDTNAGIIIMAATNRSDVLDSALLRPGRFDRIIQVSLPDIREREKILKLHVRNKKVDPDINWYKIAERTPGFSGAQLENVLNEAAILMVRENKKIITIHEIDEAIDRVVGGPAKKTRAMTKKDKDIVSYHESGHALIGLKLESASKVQKVTIIPRGHAGGYTIMTPKDETLFSSKNDLLAMIAGYLGGRAAEEIMFGKENITTGAHDDFDKATNIARKMVMQFGMSDLGITKLLTMNDETYGKTEGSYSEETAKQIDKEVKKILDESYIIAINTIRANMKTLELLAESLRTLETITAEQIEYIDKHNKLPEIVVEQKAKRKNEEAKIKEGKIINIDVEDVFKELEEIENQKKNSKVKKDKPKTVKKTKTTTIEVIEKETVIKSKPKPKSKDKDKK